MPNKAQFIEMLAERLDGDRKRAAAALDAMIDSVYAAIARGEKVAITGFGVFERRDRAARTARNPATGAPVNVAASRVPAFRPGTEFRAIANGARDFTAGGTARAQAAVSRAAGAMRGAADAVKKATKSPGKKSAPAKKSTAQKSTAQKSTAQKSTAKKSAPAKKSAAKKSAPAKKSTAQKSTAKKAAAKAPAKKSAAKKSPAKKTTKKAAAKKR